MQDSRLLLEASLERAAEALGDITGPVMDRFYAAFPAARAAFERLAVGVGGREWLEADMVARSLDCVMTWLDRPVEVEIQMIEAAPHHEKTLGVPRAWYRGLQDAVIDVLIATVPADRPDEREVLAKIRRELGDLIEASAAARVRAA